MSLNEDTARSMAIGSRIPEMLAEIKRLKVLCCKASIMMKSLEPSSCITVKESNRIEAIRKLLREASKEWK